MINTFSLMSWSKTEQMTSERAGELILQERMMRIDYKKRGANFWMVKTQSPQFGKRIL